MPFYGDDGKPRYLTTNNRMIIPVATGRNYEVSMSPSNKFVEMRLEQRQGYPVVQQQRYSQHSAVVGASTTAHLGGSALAPSNTHIAHLNQRLVANPVGQTPYQQHPAVNGQVYAAAHGTGQAQYHHHHHQPAVNTHQQAHYAPVAQPSAGHLATQVNQGVLQHLGHAAVQQHQQHHLVANTQALTQHRTAPIVQHQQQLQQYPIASHQALVTHPIQAPNVQQQQHAQQFPTPNNPPSARFVTKCHPNGHCEQVAQDQQHSTVVQQARSHIAQTGGSTCNGLYAQGQAQGSAPPHKGLRDRRLFPYSEVPIAAYPFNK